VKPRALDLFCGAGGAGMGLHQAGFDVVGVDIKPQPRYPFTFHQADALTFPLDGFDFIWASPPCQAYSITAKLHDVAHPQLVEAVRERLAASGTPYVIENVVGAPLIHPFTLCGSMFGLRVLRHRLFEASFFVLVPGHPEHRGTSNSSRRYSSFETGADFICVAGHNFKREDGAAAMGVDWPATREEIAQMIPPAYAEFIGRAALMHLEQREAA
jgi:DNA (cytosine-5)-methyltransferase 1